MRQVFNRAEGLCFFIRSVFPWARREVEFVLLSEPIPGPLGNAAKELSFWVEGTEGYQALSQGLRKAWGKMPADRKNVFISIAATCEHWAPLGITLAWAWREVEGHTDTIIENGIENLKSILSPEALSRVDRNIRRDIDLSDQDAIISEIVADLKAILVGEYELPFRERTSDAASAIYQNLIMENDFEVAKGVGLAERLFRLTTSINDSDKFTDASKDFAVYLLARRLARDYGHDSNNFTMRVADGIELESNPDPVDAFSLADSRIDLSRLIAQTRLSPGERRIIELIADGYEGDALESAAMDSGIAKGSVWKLKSRALEKLRSAAI